MSVGWVRCSLLTAGLLLLVPASGCFVATDLLNPEFFSALGFDPATIIPPQGRLVIAFRNATSFPADFYAITWNDPTGAAADFELVFATGVEGGETRTMVVDCPVGAVLPGAAGQGTAAPAAVVYAVAETAASVISLTYEGSALLSGNDFVCGDVIEIRVAQTGEEATDAGAYSLQVQVLPGR